MEQIFKIRAYGRTELAQLYSPDLNSQSAYRKFKKWLMINPQLNHLCEMHQRTFSPAQVADIVSIIGEP